MRRMIVAMSNLVPARIKQIIVGSPSHPSSVANTIRTVLDQVPGEPFPCLPCSGILKGYKMRVDWSRFRAFAYGTWETDVVRALREVVHEGFVAIDIGAHHGYYALILSKLVGARGHVIAFEPMPSNFLILEENIGLNHCSNVEIVNKAVSDLSGRVVAGVRNEGDSGTFSLLKKDSAQSVTIDVVSLDDFLFGREVPVDFIEIDVEGVESSVLRGARKTIELHHPILLVEIHHFGTHPESNQVPKQLMELGYELKWLVKWRETSHLLATWKGESSWV